MNKTELMRLVLYSNKTGKKIFHPRFYDPISEKVDENNRKLFIKTLGEGIIDPTAAPRQAHAWCGCRERITMWCTMTPLW